MFYLCELSWDTVNILFNTTDFLCLTATIWTYLLGTHLFLREGCGGRSELGVDRIDLSLKDEAANATLGSYLDNWEHPQS